MADTVNTVIEWGIVLEQTVPESSVPETYNDYPKDTWTYTTNTSTFNSRYAETLFVRGYNYLRSLEVGTVNATGNIYISGNVQ